MALRDSVAEGPQPGAREPRQHGESDHSEDGSKDEAQRHGEEDTEARLKSR